MLQGLMSFLAKHSRSIAKKSSTESRLQSGQRVVRLPDHGLQLAALRERLLRLPHLLSQLH